MVEHHYLTLLLRHHLAPKRVVFPLMRTLELEVEIQSSPHIYLCDGGVRVATLLITNTPVTI